MCLTVPFVRFILGFWLALAWAPLTAHCQIEVVAGVHAISCAADDEAADHHTPCEGKACCSWEAGAYRLPQTQPDLVLPCPAGPALCLADLELVLTAPKVQLDPPVFSPPDSPRPWQFLFRAALPARAPSSDV